MKSYNRCWIILVLILSCGMLTGQTSTDTLVLPDELKFSVVDEENFFNTILKSETPYYLNAFLSASGKFKEPEIERSVNRYKDFLQGLNTEKLNNCSPSKKIKTIYKAVHNEFFKKYEIKTSFDQIFNEGIYNCVTATALYGIILYDLKIPYTIVETQTHVYLVAYPEKEEIKIETIDPTAGFLIFDQRSKKSFVDHMHNIKFISDDEYIKSTTDELFNKYYYTDNKINLNQLLALQYLNLALYNITDHNNESGYPFLEKSYYLYPTERTKFLMLLSLAEIIKINNYESLNDLKYLVKLSRYTSFGITTSDIVNEFSRITNQHLISKSDLSYYDDVYNYLIKKLTNDEQIKEISFIYYYERGRYLLNKGQNKESLDWFSKAYKLKPQHADAQNAFVQSLAMTFNSLSANQVLTKMEEYRTQFNDLNQNKTFVKLLLHAYLLDAYEHYTMQQPDIAGKELEKFEDLYNSNREIDILQETIADAYSSAGVYYFRKGNYKKAKAYINKGLEYAPGNFRLLMSRDSF